MVGFIRLKVAEFIYFFLLLLEVPLATLVFLLSVVPPLFPFLLIVFVSGRRGVVLTQTVGIVILSPSLLAIVVATLFLDPLLFICILLILYFQVTFQLAELGFNLVLTILADHLNSSESLLSLA